MESEIIKQKLTQLISIINIELQSSAKSGKSLRGNAKSLKIWTIALSGLVTVVLGLTFLGQYGKWIAIVLSAILTALNSWDGYAGYDRRLQQELSTVNSLKLLLQDITLYMTGNNNLDQTNYIEFKKRYDVILEQYITERKEQENKKGKDQDKPNSEA